MTTLKIGVCGASGRMGQMLIAAVLADVRCRLSAALDLPHSPLDGQDAGLRLGRATGKCPQRMPNE